MTDAKPLWTQTTAQTSSQTLTLWSLAKWIPALLLICAAVVKTISSRSILASGGLLSSPATLFFVIGFEVGCGLFIVTSEPRRAWFVSLLTFGVLALFSGYAAVTGRSCHCFGSTLSPRLMLLIDLGVLAFIATSRPIPGETSGSASSRVGSPVLCSTLLSLAGAFSAFAYHSVVTPSPIEFLLAESLFQQKWPLTEDVHRALKPLEKGRWLVVILRPDCEHCKELAEKWRREPVPSDPSTRLMSFVAEGDKWGFCFDCVALIATSNQLKLQAIHWAEDEPFFAAPAVFLVEDGVVVDAADGNDADGILARYLNRSSM